MSWRLKFDVNLRDPLDLRYSEILSGDTEVIEFK